MDNDEKFKTVYERLIRIGINKRGVYVQGAYELDPLRASAHKFAKLYKQQSKTEEGKEVTKTAAAELAAAVWMAQSISQIEESDAQRLVDDIYDLVER
jgi:hypothetical protein